MRPADCWRLIAPPQILVGAMAEGLASHFETLLHHLDVNAPDTPAVVPLDPPLMGLELQTILNTHYQGAASSSPCPVPSYCLCHWPLPALNMLAPWI